MPTASGLRSMKSSHVPLVVLRCKVVIVGDASVGKTALAQVFHSGGPTFPKNYMMTVGAEFLSKQVPIPNTNAVVELYIFDCAGQSIFNQLEMNSKYYENASAVMVVYDVTSSESLRSTTKWIMNVRSTRPTGPPIIGCLVGNKADLRDGTLSRAEVSHDEASRLASDLGLNSFEVSASANTEVDTPFIHIAKEFYKRYLETVHKAEEISSMAV